MSVTNLSKRRGTILDEIMTYHREQLPKIMREVPLEDVRARAWSALEEIATSAEGEICVVSHKMALSAILCAAIGLELRHAMRLELELASTSVLERRPGRGWRLLRLNTPAL